MPRRRPASRPKPALDSLLEEAKLAPLIRRARWLDTLGRHLHACLPAPLRQHARLANIEGDSLIFLVDSPVWHARLRLSSGPIVDAARRIGLQVASVRIRTARQPFDRHAHEQAAIDAHMQRRHGTTPAEAQTLAQIRALLDG